MKAFIISFVFLSFILLIPTGYTENEIGEELKLYLGQIKVIPVSSPNRIVIGNPDVADVTSVTKEEMMISPKAVGSTTFVFWDNFGEQSYKINVFAEDITEVKRRIDTLLKKVSLPDVYTQAEEEEGKVFLLGKVKSSLDREKISLALGSLKEKTVDLIEVKEEEAGVEIDVQVLELNKDASKKLGFSWPGGVTLTEQESPGITGTGKWLELFKVVKLNRAAFSWTLDALVQEGKARLLSRPRLTCQSGKEAELLVGGEKPIFTTQITTIGGGGTSVSYKEYGIKLKIKPVVTEEERIKLSLNIEVSDIGSAETIGAIASPTAKAYPLSKRSASTELFLDNEQTLVIGGLIKEKSEEDIRKTPGLGDLPVLGLLFRQKTVTRGGGHGERGNAELFITLTPKIVTKEKEATKEIEPKVISAVVSATTQQEYASIVQRHISQNLIYPLAAKEAGLQGAVKLRLHLSYLGELLEARIESSSGYQTLDDNTLSVAKQISTYPPFPPSIQEKELWIDVPIVYRLD